MYRRRNPKTGKREGNWYICVAGNRRSSGYSDREKAKELEHKLNEEARDRRNGLIVPTWEEAAADWIHQNPVVSGSYEAKKMLAFWTPRLKGMKLRDITARVVHNHVVAAKEKERPKFLVDLIKPVPANSTANGYVSFVSRIIRHGSNLNPKLTYYPKPAGRDRWLTLEEWDRLVGKMEPDLADICTFALATGLREANDMEFRWAWLRDTWAEIPAGVTKTGKPYTIPLNRTAQAVIKKRRDSTIRHPDLVFLNRGKPWYRMALCTAIGKAARAAGIEGFTFHCFRHTFASWLAQKGVSHSIRARLGCWATATMADRYSHFDVESLRPFAEIIDRILNEKRAALDSHTASDA